MSSHTKPSTAQDRQTVVLGFQMEPKSNPCGPSPPPIKEDERPVGIRTAHMKEDKIEWRYFAKLNTF